MKAYVVDARLTYEVQANTADEALRLVSLNVDHNQVVSVEYSIRERQQEPVAAKEPVMPKGPQPSDLHGLTKPVYTASEVASILGASRYSVYELVRRGVVCVRLGRKVLIPRSTIVALLNGEVRLRNRKHPPPFGKNSRVVVIESQKPRLSLKSSFRFARRGGKTSKRRVQ